MSDRRKARQKKQRQRDLRRAEQQREAHARLVVERAGDPSFVQRERTPTGYRLTWDKETASGREIDQLFREQQALFRQKFGRDPGPDDPVFFDPDADQPAVMPGERLDDALAGAASRLLESGEVEVAAMTLAARELGFMITTENQHLFSAADIEAWGDAVERQLEQLDARGE